MFPFFLYSFSRIIMNGFPSFFPGQIKEKPGLILALVEGRMCYIGATRLRLLTHSSVNLPPEFFHNFQSLLISEQFANR